jgi:hypothetical protein
MSRPRHIKRQLGSVVSLKDLRRPDPTHEPRAVILIVCEGRKTEPKYFNGLCKKLRLTTVEVEIVGDSKGSAPISVVDDALDRRNERRTASGGSVSRPEYDSVWCVFDVESPGNNPSFAQAVVKAENNALKLAISNPCFEFWILLHFLDTSRSFHDCKEVISEVKRHISGYEKGKDCFELLDSRTGNAIRLARKQLLLKPADKWPNPCTFAHELVEELQSVARRPSG